MEYVFLGVFYCVVDFGFFVLVIDVYDGVLYVGDCVVCVQIEYGFLGVLEIYDFYFYVIGVDVQFGYCVFQCFQSQLEVVGFYRF